jgi:hypothetical protein
MKTSKKKTSPKPVASEPNSEGIVTLLLKDHRAMKELMSDLKTPRYTNRQRFAVFAKLEKLVHSHMIAEEKALLERIKNHPKLKDDAVEGLEEHEIHRVVIASIHRVSDPDRRFVRMKSFCEILEHHLREEEEDLFPKFKKNTARVTRKKIGKTFLKARRKSSRKGEDLGALEPRHDDTTTTNV